MDWLAAIHRKDIKKENYPFIGVCSDHFRSGKPAMLYDNTSPDWIPTLKLGHDELKAGDTSRHDRAIERATKRRKLSEEQAIAEEERVCFISDGWGGRVGDKHLTENSGLLNHLIPGDTILADRGFDIEDSEGIYCARVIIPAFTKG